MEQEKKETITIYTDGACRGNPGEGGWGAYIILNNSSKKEIFGYEISTTNNRMELTAAIQALKLFKDKEYLKVYTDSNYLKQGITLWINSWKKNSWNNKQKKLVKNVDLWKELDFFNNYHNINWYWVKAHDGNFGNEKADMLANKAIDLRISNL